MRRQLQYREMQASALAAAKRGYVDDIIEASDTRQRVSRSIRDAVHQKRGSSGQKSTERSRYEVAEYMKQRYENESGLALSMAVSLFALVSMLRQAR